MEVIELKNRADLTCGWYIMCRWREKKWQDVPEMWDFGRKKAIHGWSTECGMFWLIPQSCMHHGTKSVCALIIAAMHWAWWVYIHNTHSHTCWLFGLQRVVSISLLLSVRCAMFTHLCVLHYTLFFQLRGTRY